MMRAASKARAYIERIDPQAEEPRFDREAVRMSGIVARMMERYRLGLLALLKVKGPAKQVVLVKWGEEEPALTRHTRLAREARDRGAGGGDGSGGGDDSDGGSPPPNGSPDGLAPPAGPAPAAGLGRLRNGNPAGDFTRAPRCGARTRAGASCRQPSMPNCRCRLHGGRSTGPRTEAGLARARSARLRHGADTREMIALRAAASRCSRRIDRLLRAARGRPAWHGVDPTDCPSPLGTTMGFPAASPAGTVPSQYVHPALRSPGAALRAAGRKMEPRMDTEERRRANPAGDDAADCRRPLLRPRPSAFIGGSPCARSRLAWGPSDESTFARGAGQRAVTGGRRWLALSTALTPPRGLPLGRPAGPAAGA